MKLNRILLVLVLALAMLLPASAQAADPVNPWVHQQVLAWQDCVDVAYGRIPADVAVRAGRLFEANTGQWLDDQIIATKGKYICWVGPASEWKHESEARIDYSDYAIGPTLGEDHTHMESSRQTPNWFAELNTVYYQSWMIEASHELANVFEVDKTTQFFLAGWDAGLPFNVYSDLASAAPPTPFEFTGAGDTYNYTNFLRLFQSDPRVKLVDEVMNGPVWKDKAFPGHDGLLGLIEAAFATGNRIQGHLSQYAEYDDINAAASVHLYSDHENSDGTDTVPMEEVAWRKITHGVTLLLRADDADKIIPYFVSKGLQDWPVVITTDDRAPDETLYDTYEQNGVTYNIGGSKDNILRVMRAGMPFEAAWKAGSINAAKYARVDELEGSVTPGKFASFIVLQGDPRDFDAKAVWVNGQKVVQDGKFIGTLPTMDWSTYTGTMNTGELTLDMFAVKAEGTTAKVALLSPFYFNPDYETAILPVINGEVQRDPSQGIVKFSIIDRYHGIPNVANMFWTGDGPAEDNAAFCETESHDNHYLQCLSTSDEAIPVAVNRLKEIDGGYIFVKDGKVVAEVSLPIGGLMADRPAQQLADEFHAFWDALGQYKWLGGLNLEKVQRYATLTCDPWHWVLVTPFPGCPSGFVNVTTAECRPVAIGQ